MNSMVLRLILRRLALGALTLLLVSIAVFLITNLLPGDAAQTALGQAATPETVAALRHQFGLDLPLPLRYANWLSGMLSGDPGMSLVNNSPVAQMIAGRLPSSLLLAGVTAAVSVPIALLLGIASAMYRGSLLDRCVNVGAVMMVSVPEFLVATIAVMIFAVKLRWLSALSHTSDINGIADFLKAYAMPVMTLCCVIVAQMARMTRAAVIDQLRAPYVEMALLKGASSTRIVLRHALPNAVGPIANAVAMSLSYLLGGVIIVESIFNYPGISTLMVDAVTTRDMPLVQACAMIFCAGYLLLVLVADLLAIISNPRLRNR
ncbi:peptide/nickel transport system permease protein [Herbaspirillum sp. Sphag1AN]|uniref:ABC transporter permease n=1 Tax=unclassified Herbaspirillum TaxID=2624150 RepID=UPI001614F19F|nr:MULTISPECIES: ABC transporter permease [unclassified Herbaspirillum]MBB3213856.1 peptide/nickel transport system permease protein [Herbaspirillum sp. Sphag1AN]MBB3247053.1 peptide/nickel transport system permease protein [Herbaspirillum sp. Sphag64]